MSVLRSVVLMLATTTPACLRAHLSWAAEAGIPTLVSPRSVATTTVGPDSSEAALVAGTTALSKTLSADPASLTCTPRGYFSEYHRTAMFLLAPM